ncbi:hypothetical protein ScPMuIL_006842 [Solemya velum]
MWRNPKFWGPYLPERQWATVREDNSLDGSCWEDFTHNDATKRVYRWGEDGLLGVCDIGANLCASPAFWNGVDPILKERLFGLTGPQGCHGEDVKELYYYLENTTDHTYMKALYKYPQSLFPYQQLIEENNKPYKGSEYEILDTGVFDKGYWDIFVEYAKDTPGSLLCRYTVHNRSQKETKLVLLPQFSFRNTWAWTSSDKPKPDFRQVSDRCIEASFEKGVFILEFYKDGAMPKELIFTENANKTNSSAYVKDGFHQYIVRGDETSVCKSERSSNYNLIHGTKCAAVYELVVPPSEKKQVKWTLYPASGDSIKHLTNKQFEEIFMWRLSKTNQLYDSLLPVITMEEEKKLIRQAYAGLLWSKQFYCYSVDLWIKDKLQNELFEQVQSCTRTLEKEPIIRNVGWEHMRCQDIISMPDKWEFPWFATWDLAFHMLPFVRIDPQFAMEQILLLLSDRYMHPSGQLPAYEFDFGDVNPPVHAWACLKVFHVTKCLPFLKKCFHRLLINFTWWMNTKQTSKRNLFTGGFLGMDNISVLDRSNVPEGMQLYQADATGWMAFYCLCMLEISVELVQKGDNVYEDMALRFFNQFISIVTTLNDSVKNGGLWHDHDKFYYDVIDIGRKSTPIRVQSMVGLVPLFATTHLHFESNAGLDNLISKLKEEAENNSEYILNCEDGIALVAVPREKQKHLFTHVFDEAEFLSPYGIRSLSKIYKEKPYIFTLDGEKKVLKYAPGESDSRLFGGNSNWRGPVWMCMNYLLTESLEIYHKIHNPEYTMTHGSLAETAKEISRRIVSIFKTGEQGYRPVHGNLENYKSDAHWKDLILFYEYFHGHSGKGCGASHQTGWTSLIIEFIHNLNK